MRHSPAVLPCRAASSENEPQSELDLTRTGARILNARGRYLAESGTALRNVGIVKVRMVKDVEHFGAELEVALLLAQPEALQHREIEIMRGRPDDHIAPGGAVAPDEGVAEAPRVEPLRRVVREGIGIAGEIRASPGLGA